MKLVHLSVFSAVCLVCAGTVFAQQGKEISPYAVTANKVTLAEPAALKLDPDAINMLAPNLGQLSAEIQPVVRNFMVLWCAAKKDGPCQVQWTVEAPADGLYDVTASIEGKRFSFGCHLQRSTAGGNRYPGGLAPTGTWESFVESRRKQGAAGC